MCSVSWTPDKGLTKGTYTASVEWNFGPFGKLSAKQVFNFDPDAKPDLPRSISMKKIILKYSN
jgi:hypothetical protein